MGRLIPAHAGKTPRPASRGALGWAHPRSRGENHDQDAYPDPRPGSSPLTRGKPRGRARTHHRPRLIPAHAGKTGVGIVEVVGAGAHPRSRGENIDGQRETAEDWGSSPLTRGKQRLHRAAHHYSGLIPAHAGKTPRASRQRLGTRAHPRSRGENRDVEKTFITGTGSSPLTRGKQGRRGQGPDPLGLIPAHAGKTPRGSPTSRTPWAHPRSRGEN